MAFSMDELLGHLGRPGRYQLLVCVLLCLNYFQIAFNHLAMAFFGADPLEYRCGTESLATSNKTCPTLPKKTWCLVRENCTSCNMSTPYILEDREWTVNAEWDLVCDKSYLSNLASSIYFVGVMVGGPFFGHLADWLGRFPILIITLYLPVAVGVGLFFANSYVLFVVLRLLMGFFIPGLQVVVVSLIMEYFSPKQRAVAACVLELFWGVGLFIMALIAFLIRDWRWMQLCFSLLILVTLSYVWLIPESLRWLLTKGKYDKAEKLANRIARFNGLDGAPSEVVAMIKTHKQSSETPRTYTIIDIFRNKITLLRSVVLWYIWFAISLGYYGLILNTGVLGGFKYTNFLVGAAVEIVAYILAVFILFYFGRRRPLLVYLVAGGVACIASGTVEDGTWKTALALLGRFGISGAFSVMFLYTSELYPTSMRNVGLGSCTFWTRVGGLLAPQINLLGTITYQPLPIILFGILSIVAGFLALILPETLNVRLPDTLAESEDMGWGCGTKQKGYTLRGTEMEPTKTG